MKGKTLGILALLIVVIGIVVAVYIANNNAVCKRLEKFQAKENKTRRNST
jgi:glucose uptake protein GlcU